MGKSTQVAIYRFWGGVCVRRFSSKSYELKGYELTTLQPTSYVIDDGFIGCALVIIVGWGAYLSEGAAWRFDEEIHEALKAKLDRNPRHHECVSHSSRYLPPEEACSIGNKDNIVGVLIGDSHSNSIAYELGRPLEKGYMGLKHMWYAGCPLVLGLEVLENGVVTSCGDYSQQAFRSYSK